MLTPTKSIKSECSELGSFEVLVTLKILADETGKELWQEICLMTERETIGKLVKIAQEKFMPAEYLKKNLKLRNVTVFSTRFGLEVSVAPDGQATDGAKYTANFLNSTDLVEHTEDPRSSSSKYQKLPQDKIKNLADVEKQYSEKMDLLMKTERDLIKANKQKQTALIDLEQAEKSLKEKLEATKDGQRILDKQAKDVELAREEKKRLIGDIIQLERDRKNLDVEIKALNEKMTKKTKEIDKLNKDLEKLEKKQKEKQKYKKSVDELKKSEKECRQRLENLQEEEKNFYLMLNELKEQIQVEKLQLEDKQVQQENNFGQNFDQNNSFGQLNQEGFNPQNNQNFQSQQVDCGGEQQIGGGERREEFDKEAESSHQSNLRSVSKAFTVQCNYFNASGNCWKGDKCTFIHDLNLVRGRSRVRDAGRNYNRPGGSSTISPDFKRERREAVEKFSREREDQNASSSSYFDQNYMQDRKVYIENERFNMNPEPGELFSYVDNGPIFGAQGWAPPPPVLNGPPPQISPNSIQPLNSLPNSVNNDSYGNNQQKYDSPVRRAPLRRARPPSRKRSRGGSGINNKRLIGRNYGNNSCNNLNGKSYVLDNKQKGGRQMRKDERSSNNKNLSKRYNVSPLRENTKTSSSSGTYGTRPHSIESSIMNRITIDEPPSVGKVSSIHSRLSFENP
uniref:C3H1-type domain-containing protein n=1 Tax=Meloidogyne javanica TaxID=6303 RepID=A0A915LFM3_MELJA